MSRTAIAGAGASGMMAAIAAKSAGEKVTLFEHKDRVGRKLLMTGNGKCNLTNIRMDSGYYNSSSDEEHIIKKILDRFGAEDTIRFFGTLGIYTKNRNGGIYPYPETANAVLDALRYELRRLDITEEAGQGVEAVTVDKDRGFKLKIAGSSVKTLYFDKLILCCGGKARPETGSDGSGYDLAKSLGHSIIKPLPALTALRSDEKFFRSISGVRADASLRLFIDGEVSGSSRGELQLTDNGLSGICTFDISSAASRALNSRKKVFVMVDFLPEFTMSQAYDFIMKRKETLKDRSAGGFLTGLFNKKLNSLFLKMAEIRENTPVSVLEKEDIVRLCDVFKNFRTDVTGTGDFGHAQVVSGGVPLNEVNEHLESLKVRNLFLAGELLDADGICGGYNLQWAFSSGYVAGLSAAGQ